MFSANRFTATQHSTADEKARFCNSFATFVLGGFARSVFKPQFYRRLSSIFGHVAHYDETGFYEVWFSTPEQQRHFIQCIYEWVPMGQPEFCWVGRGAGTEVVGGDECRRHRGGHCRERAEIHRGFGSGIATSCRPSNRKTHQQFTVVAKSSNTNAFGHRQYVLVADDGSAFKVQRYYQYSWDNGQVVKVPLVMGEPNWSALQCECPERIEDCPVEV